MTDVSQLTSGEGFSRIMLDAIPLPVLVVDEDVRVLSFNASAAQLIGEDKEPVFHQLGGAVWHCIHSAHPSGCGQTEFCNECVVRNSVTTALQGQKVSRQRTKMQMTAGLKTQAVELLVTASPFDYKGRRLVLLILEDISELVALRSLLPICAKCKKIRDDQAYWHRLEEYLTVNMKLDLTHGLCPHCAKELFPEYYQEPKG